MEDDMWCVSSSGSSRSYRSETAAKYQSGLSSKSPQFFFQTSFLGFMIEDWS